MKVAIIAPVPLLQKYATKSKYHMALAHLVLENAAYASFYKACSKMGDYVILDNSIIELGSALTIELIIKAAEMIGADEIILPDAYQDCAGTLQLVERALSRHSGKLKKYKLMVVPQGKTMSEWLSCYGAITHNFPMISVIGIPKSTSTFSDVADRAGLVQYLYAHGLVKYDKEYHLLGVYNNPIEIARMSSHKWIRGVDTCLPVLCGQLGIQFHYDKGMLIDRPSNKPDFYSKSDDFPGLISRNILCMLNWAIYYES